MKELYGEVGRAARLGKAQLQPEAGADLQSLLNSRHSGDEYRYLGLGLYVCPFGKGQSKCVFSGAGERERLGTELRERLGRRLL